MKKLSKLRVGFTLVELMVAIAVAALLLVLLLQLTDSLGTTLTRSKEQLVAFQSARAGFDRMVRTLKRATLNTSWEYVDAAGNPRTATNRNNFVPDSFARSSSLHFISGPASVMIPGGGTDRTPGQAIFFQAPLGHTASASSYGSLNQALNAVGFWVQYSDDSAEWPSFVSDLFGDNRSKYQLVEWIQPLEEFDVYNETSRTTWSDAWFQPFLPSLSPSGASTVPANGTAANPIGENIVALFVIPKLSPPDEVAVAGSSGFTEGALLAPNYVYDSRAWVTGGTPPSGLTVEGGEGLSEQDRRDLMANQLPPLVEIVMVAVSGKDTDRLSSNELTATIDTSGLFEENAAGVAAFEQDLQEYLQNLTANNIDYRVFRDTIGIPGAKWSK